MPKKRSSASKKASAQTEEFEIPEDEQRRLIEGSGLLGKLAQIPEGVLPPHIEELCYAIYYIIPFSFLLLTMEVLVHYQYGRNPDLAALTNRMLPGVPTLRYQRRRATQILFFFVSVGFGSRLIWMINKANWIANMQQGPPLATIWIFAIVVLDLGPACLSLILTGLYVRYAGLKLSM
ncbi:hypothetical protein DL96DRAFT_1594518 [Flagelloscypha sp. PMI_526]|nr:hypothetical protein DL96DRAFT_1594518 [Flagelloscypha sp. PMI_526]